MTTPAKARALADKAQEYLKWSFGNSAGLPITDQRALVDALRSLADQVEALQKSTGSFQHIHSPHLVWTDHAGIEQAMPAVSLIKQVEALQKDAERYRWLRDDVTDEPGMHHADTIYLKHLHGAELDAAIDRAREAT